MIRLCAFSDEADASLSGQIDALHRNAIALTELRSVGGKNAIIKCVGGNLSVSRPQRKRFAKPRHMDFAKLSTIVGVDGRYDRQPVSPLSANGANGIG